MKRSFYSKMPAEVKEVSLELKTFMEKFPDSIEDVMRGYFCSYWQEFCKEWKKDTNENLDWISFALMPHNSIYFTEWVMVNNPEVLTKVKSDLECLKEDAP